MRVHILGIAGTFMGSLAQLAKALGHEVSGCDQAFYPPMSEQLAQANIAITTGFAVEDLPDKVDCFIVGNAISRGNPAMEHILNQSLAYTSGPQWLKEHVLKGKWVAAIAGTHGKTTTASMLAWILEYANMQPGFLIGGVPENFGVSARLGNSNFFVIEADEYDTAFFDKRSKFVHYQPRTLGINNLEYDHADIFPDLAAIERQFHHLLRSMAQQAHIFVSTQQPAIERVLKLGVWSDYTHVGNPDGVLRYRLNRSDGRSVSIQQNSQTLTLNWQLEGEHNVQNALMALACAQQMGVPLAIGITALGEFKSVKRRMQLRANGNGLALYDDFAHHPSAIQTSLAGARARMTNEPAPKRLIAIIEVRSNSMKMGAHKAQLLHSVQAADYVYWFSQETLNWDSSALSNESMMSVYHDLPQMLAHIGANTQAGDDLIVMSNGGFGDIFTHLIQQLGLQEVA